MTNVLWHTTYPAKVIAIIPAAGIGSRMQQAQAKQYLTVQGKTVVEHAIQGLLNDERIAQVIIALRADDQQFHQLPVAAHPKIKTVLGGAERAYSVLAALEQAPTDTDWVMVHDAARPCLTLDELELLWQWLANEAKADGAILAAPVFDTIKQADSAQQIVTTLERQQIWRALTPQLFPYSLLKHCLTQALMQQQMVTDEASAMELFGYHPYLLAGEKSNIKITTQDDLALAQFYLNYQQQQRVRTD